MPEAGEKRSPMPILFDKFNSTLNHHGGSVNVSMKRVAKKFD